MISKIKKILHKKCGCKFTKYSMFKMNSHELSKKLVLLFFLVTVICTVTIFIFSKEQDNPEIKNTTELIQRDYNNTRDYTIFNRHYYYPTNDTIKDSDIEYKLGEIVRVGTFNELKDGDTVVYTPGSNLYKIRGIPIEEKIAVETNNRESKFNVLRQGAKVYW